MCSPPTSRPNLAGSDLEKIVQRLGPSINGDRLGAHSCRVAVHHHGERGHPPGDQLGTNAVGGGQDVDTLIAAFEAAKPAGIPVPPRNRIITIP